MTKDLEREFLVEFVNIIQAEMEVSEVQQAT